MLTDFFKKKSNFAVLLHKVTADFLSIGLMSSPGEKFTIVVMRCIIYAIHESSGIKYTSYSKCVVNL